MHNTQDKLDILFNKLHIANLPGRKNRPLESNRTKCLEVLLANARNLFKQYTELNEGYTDARDSIGDMVISLKSKKKQLNFTGSIMQRVLHEKQTLDRSTVRVLDAVF
jgi:hypothetical protein